MIFQRFFPGFALLALVAGSFSAWAQSFDCAKASTPVERLICAEPKLGARDSELAGEVKKAVVAVPTRREALLAEERGWVKQRDKHCPVPGAPLSDEARSRAIDCLMRAYAERIAALQSGGVGDPAELCRRLGDRYRALLERDPQAPFKSSFYAGSPLETLAAAGSGVTIAKPVAEIRDYSPRKITDWAKSQPKPFTIPQDVSKALDETAHSQLSIDRVPGANFFAASVVEGTAACYSAVYFEVERGRARLADGPAIWESDEGAGCGVTRSFGTFDQAPVAFEERHDYAPSLSSSLSVARWGGRRFDPACVITFEFAPRFDPHETFNSWDESCDGADCDELRRAALALVEEAQKTPLAAQEVAIGRLTASQRHDFEELKTQAGPALEPARDETSDASNPASYTESAPLLLPLVHDGRVYLAGLGHFTIGWRIFSDWSVTLKQIENGKIADRAAFAIGMTKGKLEKVSVK